jgi:hypothetical protein
MLYHIIFLLSGILLIFGFTVMHSGKDNYDELKKHIHNQFLADLAYNLDIIGELTPKEADFRIDEFEDKWKGYVSDSELKVAIGRLIESQLAVGF